MTLIDYELISGLDDLFYDLTLTDEATGTALTSGTVSVVLCEANTTTSLGTGASKALTHVADGRWTATHDYADFASLLPRAGVAFDKVLVVAGVASRRLARCKRVGIVDEAV